MASNQSGKKHSRPTVQHTQLFIDGRFRNSSDNKTFPTIDPFTGKVIAEVHYASAEDIENAIEVARTAFEGSSWKQCNGAQRGKLLHELATLIDKNRVEIAVSWLTFSRIDITIFLLTVFGQLRERCAHCRVTSFGSICCRYYSILRWPGGQYQRRYDTDR